MVVKSLLPYNKLHFINLFFSLISSTNLQLAQFIPAMGAFLLFFKHTPVLKPLIKQSLCLELSSPDNCLVILPSFTSSSTSYFPNMGFLKSLFNTALCQGSHIEYFYTSFFLSYFSNCSQDLSTSNIIFNFLFVMYAVYLPFLDVSSMRTGIFAAYTS